MAAAGRTRQGRGRFSAPSLEWLWCRASLRRVLPALMPGWTVLVLLCFGRASSSSRSGHWTAPRTWLGVQSMTVKAAECGLLLMTFYFCMSN